MLQFAALALFLGIKHSFDADHLVAVSNLLSKARSYAHSARMAASWAAGHMLTATVITVLIFMFKDSFLTLVLGKLNFLVALMLIFVGLLSIWQASRMHTHRHSHGGMIHEHPHLHSKEEGKDHSHAHMFGIGIVHGLASNDELLLLLTVSLGVSSLLEMVAGVAIFSAGVVIGMIGFGLLFTLPLLKARSAQISRAVNLTVGCISIIYGMMMLFGLA